VPVHARAYMIHPLLFLVLILLSAAYAGGPPPSPTTCPPATRDSLLPCILRAMDFDGDETITTQEIGYFLESQYTGVYSGPTPVAPPLERCIPQLGNAFPLEFRNGTSIMNLCDADFSGNLTLVDWVHPNSCIGSRARQTALCKMCTHCIPPLVK
jgi:hypothetical protein